MSQYKVRKNETVRYEGDGTIVKYVRVSSIDVKNQTNVQVKVGKGIPNIVHVFNEDVIRKTYSAGSKAPRRAWVND